MLRYQKVLLSSILALVVAAPLARAQEPGSHARIVRISYLEGTVQFNGEKAVMNTPVTEGSRLVTGTDGLAEVQFEDGSAIRMASETEITFAQLARLTSGEALTRVDLDDGEAEFLITGSAAGQFAVNVRSKNVLFKQPGRFRLLSTNSDPLEIAVWKGEAGVRDRESGQEVTVNRNETFTLDPADPGQYDLEKAVVADDLDQWSNQRDQYLNSGANASTYVSSSNAGYSPSFYPSSYYSYYSYGFNDFNSCSPFYWGGGFGGQPYWLSPGGGYCWNSGFFFPWNPFITNPVVILVPPVRRPPPHIHPPTVPAVAAKAGAPPVGVKPGLRSFKFDGVQRVFNDDNFQRSVARSEGIQPGGRTGEQGPQTVRAPAGEAPRVNSHPVQPLMAPGQRPANNGFAPPAHSAPAPPPRSSMPSTSTASHGFSGSSHSSSSSSSSHSSSSSSGGRHR